MAGRSIKVLFFAVREVQYCSFLSLRCSKSFFCVIMALILVLIVALVEVLLLLPSSSLAFLMTTCLKFFGRRSLIDLAASLQIHFFLRRKQP